MAVPIGIDSGNIRLEGMLNKSSDQRAVVVCHPHPLYGGSMDNPVVETIVQAFFEKNYTTLQFNFRGVGNSTGAFDDGNGEQEDVKAAISMLAQEGFESITLAGYSFGARVNAQVVVSGCNIEDHIMVSPPVGFMSFDDVTSMPFTGLIVSGDHDEYAPYHLIEDHIKRWEIPVRYEIIKNCDHFYSAGLGPLKGILMDYLSV